MIRRRRSSSGFTLLEVVFAVVIIATALMGLQATVAGSIRSAGNSINRRAAREECRQKLEEVLAGTIDPTESGELEERPGFRWAARTEEVQVGTGETKTEVVRIVTVEMQFPADNDTGPDGGASGGASAPATTGATPGATGPTDNGDGTQTLSLSSVLPEPPAGQAPPAPAPPR